MCGIIGYIGQKKIDSVLLSALSRLEYRGYDSAGMAAVEGGKVSLLRRIGKLKELKKLSQETPLTGHLGIGHTRWATHGVPAERNAHPHTDENRQVAVVHNGIIENHQKLREMLKTQGYRFTSETDTEVLAHLIERYHIKENKTLEESVRLVLKDIEGSYAFCVISVKEEDTLIAARNGSPLVIGLGQDESFVASDATAFLEYTRDAIFLKDYEMAVVNRQGASVSSTRGTTTDPKKVRIEWDAKDVSKEGYDHFMLKEIEEQPAVLEKMIRSRIKNGDISNLFDEGSFDPEELRKVKRIILQACGTSWHAALTGKFLLEGIAGIPAEVDVSSEFRYRHLVPQPGTLVLSITQSGETIDTLMGMRRAKEMGYKTISICNVLGSTVARESDGVIYTQAGPEIGVASTKAYNAQLSILVLLSLYCAELRGMLTDSGNALKTAFLTLPEKMRAMIARKDEIKAIAEKYYGARDFLFLARGINYPNAHEGALKIKEIAYVHATGHPAGEMKHGPIALIDSQMPVVVIAPKGAVYEKMVSNIQEVKARSGKVISIVTEGDAGLREIADDRFEIPETDEFLSPLLTIVPLQYLAYYVATLRGTDVDQPRNLAKSVTVE